MEVGVADPSFGIEVGFPGRPHRRDKVNDRMLDLGRHSDRDEGAYAIWHHHARSEGLL
jgi:hypothetical protein